THSSLVIASMRHPCGSVRGRINLGSTESHPTAMVRFGGDVRTTDELRLQLQRKNFKYFWLVLNLFFEGPDRIEKPPEKHAQEIESGGDIEGEIPIACPLHDVAKDDGRSEPAEVAHHIHGPAERADISASDVHAACPTA